MTTLRRTLADAFYAAFNTLADHSGTKVTRVEFDVSGGNLTTKVTFAFVHQSAYAWIEAAGSTFTPDPRSHGYIAYWNGVPDWLQQALEREVGQ